jgi:hypothetical protein
MSKELMIHGLFLNPDSFSLSGLNTNNKKSSTEKYFNFENTFTRRNSKSKGKKMLEIKRKSQELNKKILSLENRVKHIEKEQNRVQKNVKIAEEKHKKYEEIRQFVNSEKILTKNIKSQNLQKYLETRKKISDFKQAQKLKILNKKQEILKKNATIKSEVKQKLIIGHKELEQRQFRKLSVLQEKAQGISKLSKSVREKQRMRSQSLKAMAEEEYDKKMIAEIEFQQKALDRITELESLENILLNRSTRINKLGESISSDLFYNFDSPIDFNPLL